MFYMKLRKTFQNNLLTDCSMIVTKQRFAITFVIPNRAEASLSACNSPLLAQNKYIDLSQSIAHIDGSDGKSFFPEATDTFLMVSSPTFWSDVLDKGIIHVTHDPDLETNTKTIHNVCFTRFCLSVCLTLYTRCCIMARNHRLRILHSCINSQLFAFHFVTSSAKDVCNTTFLLYESLDDKLIQIDTICLRIYLNSE